MGGNLFGMTTYVCSKCGRRADEFHIRGGLSAHTKTLSGPTTAK